jgi:predicted Fe-Mo cluster-binding NifX family protein
MRVCIPVNECAGLESPLCGHFGSAPAFVIIDTESNEIRSIANENQEHSHGMCAPIGALRAEDIDAAVVRGIGAGALSRLHAANIVVYRSVHGRVGEALAALRTGDLALVKPGMTCAGHGHQHGHDHQHEPGHHS